MRSKHFNETVILLCAERVGLDVARMQIDGEKIEILPTCKSVKIETISIDCDDYESKLVLRDSLMEYRDREAACSADLNWYDCLTSWNFTRILHIETNLICDLTSNQHLHDKEICIRCGHLSIYMNH